MKRKLTDRKKICPRCNKNRCRRNGQGEFIICESCENHAKMRKKTRMRKHIRENFKESFKDAGLPLRHKDADMKDLTLPIEESQNCFFIGDKGLGKTYAMVAMAKALIKKGHRVRYITVPELMMELKSSFNSGSNTTEQAVLHRYSSIPYLFLDDIGVEKTSDYVLQALFIMIDRRYMDDLQICVSSNLSLGELSDHGDARLVSRLVEMCDVFEFSGKDRRIK